MLMSRSSLLFAIALGITASGLSVSSVLAQDGTATTQVQADAKKAKPEQVIKAALSELAAEDQKLAQEQRFCPILPHSRLGSMGTPVKIMLDDKAVFVCCEQCSAEAKADAKKTLDTTEKLKKATIELAKLPAKDRKMAESQKYCCVADGSVLGAMGAPIKLDIQGESVFVCCEGCVDAAKADPEATLAKVAKLKKGKAKK